MTRSGHKRFLAANYRSDSGKSSEAPVTIVWTDSVGKLHCLAHESRYARHRRNDPERNWGAGRN